MVIRVERRLTDGAVLARDPADGAGFVLEREQYRRVAAVPPERQRRLAERFDRLNRLLRETGEDPADDVDDGDA